MKATMVGKEKNDITFKMDFEAEEFQNAISDAYKANRHQYPIDGFRKGKAPRKLIESKYGADIFHEDAINKLFSDNYIIALNELGINPVDNPSADFDKIDEKEGFGVTVKVTVVPEVTVKDYKGVKVSKFDDSVSDKDVEEDLAAIQKRNSRMIVSEEPAKDGDTVLLDYSGFIGEEQFEGGTAERHALTLGSNTFIPGFEEQLIGVTAGEERDIKVTFPEEYNEELAGKEAIFKCKVHEIKETELPELDDEFAKDVSEFDTLEELKTDLRHKLEKNAKDKAEYETKNAVLEKVFEATEIDIPDVMVETQIDEMINEFQQQLSQQGLDMQQYFQYLGKDITTFRDEVRQDAYKRVKTKLVVDAVAKKENVAAAEEDVEEELAKMAEMYKMEVDQLKGAMGLQGMTFLKQDIRNRKAIELMYESAVIE